MGGLRGARLGPPARPEARAGRDGRTRADRHRAGPRRIPAAGAGPPRRPARRLRPARDRRLRPGRPARPGARPTARPAGHGGRLGGGRGGRAGRRDRGGRLRRTPALDDEGWRTLLSNLDRIDREISHLVTLHPHVGTMVETGEEVERVLEGAAVSLCLDTGHMLAGGADPLDVVRKAPERIAHAHLKDVDAGLAGRVRAGELTYTDAVRAGMYRPLGRGDVDVAGIVSGLTAAGYTGWYVMEQDVILTSADADPVENVRASLAYLTGLASPEDA
ncbi:sugar phosphate isomerase/epimerase [Microbispora sp. GKU 823]|uniref:sugar phosphate isomerase/epimerase family protein n=1 Tax=Microbispora sp. GKU 823 TaxID=1652100 RepID=UPI00277B497F|nr:sugar phosphate isomerase/epimerase [Microbispora sp. GKU 823]